ncbi:MAG: ABC transporter ATP-binding protein [Candidatus Promineifilaceae bacterium]|nr:ABC transporter ATP-binding protein [Candidatus Promineifilaceae bacterium]
MTSQEAQPILSFTHVNKRFTFSREKPQSVLETVISVFNRRSRHPKQDLWAVKDLSFEVFPGQSLGIIGRNGSGKSTVLKLMARILRPTSGRVMVKGRVSALLELGAGFHPDLTGRENISLNASVMGLDETEVDKNFDSIVEFSELGEYIDMPVKHYSSGMYMRLGFSVAIHVQPTILIVDEILAVGDQAFQMKCIDRIHEMKRQGVTIILISHNLEIIRRLCSHLIWLEHGQMRASGPAEEVANEYKEYSNQAVGKQLTISQKGSYRRWGSLEIEITNVRFLDASGSSQTLFKTGDEMIIEIAYIAHQPIRDPEFGLAIFRQDGVHVNGPNSHLAGLEMGDISGSGVVQYHIKELPLLPARYQVTAAVHDSRLMNAYDYHELAYPFRVITGGAKETDGLIELPATWEWLPSAN